MSAASSMTDTQEALRRLIPLNTLPASRFEQVCAAIKIEEAPKGTALFHQGEATDEFVYLLAGTISLQAGGVEMDSVSSGTDVARFALAHQNPRKVAAIAKDHIQFVRISTELVYPREEARPRPPEAKAQELSETSENDWMSSLLRSPIFQRLPPANLQAVLRAIEEVKVKAGEVIFHQDDEGDYFYIIKQGQCSLTRKPSPTAKEIKLATLKSRDSFGEDALISEQPRTLTVTMDTSGELLRLDKANFRKLVSDAVITKVSAQEAIETVNEGGIWLDVRMPDQYPNGQPRGPVIRAPFFSLRMMLSNLDRDKRYIAVCENGKISEAAAYLLLRFRFNARVLKNGLGALPPEEIVVEPLESPPSEPIPEPASTAIETEITEAAPPPPAPSTTEPLRTPAAPGEPDIKKLEARLARLIAEKGKSDTELQQARQAVHRLQAALSDMKQERDQLLRQGASASGAPAPPEPGPEEALRQELEDLKARYAEAMFEKDLAGQEVESLEKQVAELKATVGELAEKESYGKEVEAVRAELKMVRERAGHEVAALQAKLGEVEAERVRLDNDLQLAKVQLSVREAATDPDGEGPAKKPSVMPAMLGGAVIGLLLAALVAGGLFGLPAGRDLVRSWLGESAPTVSTPTPAAAPTDAPPT